MGSRESWGPGRNGRNVSLTGRVHGSPARAACSNYLGRGGHSCVSVEARRGTKPTDLLLASATRTVALRTTLLAPAQAALSPVGLRRDGKVEAASATRTVALRTTLLAPAQAALSRKSDFAETAKSRLLAPQEPLPFGQRFLPQPKPPYHPVGLRRDGKVRQAARHQRGRACGIGSTASLTTRRATLLVMLLLVRPIAGGRGVRQTRPCRTCRCEYRGH